MGGGTAPQPGIHRGILWAGHGWPGRLLGSIQKPPAGSGSKGHPKPAHLKPVVLVGALQVWTTGAQPPMSLPRLAGLLGVLRLTFFSHWLS